MASRPLFEPSSSSSYVTASHYESGICAQLNNVACCVILCCIAFLKELGLARKQDFLNSSTELKLFTYLVSILLSRHSVEQFKMYHSPFFVQISGLDQLNHSAKADM